MNRGTEIVANATRDLMHDKIHTVKVKESRTLGRWTKYGKLKTYAAPRITRQRGTALGALRSAAL